MTEHTTLRSANIARQREWDQDDRITLTYRGNELAGETGEACNVIKKLERERLGIRGSRDTVEHLAEELADVVICADLIAMGEGIDLDAAVRAKFNATSEKVGLKARLTQSLDTISDSDRRPAYLVPLESSPPAPSGERASIEHAIDHFEPEFIAELTGERETWIADNMRYEILTMVRALPPGPAPSGEVERLVATAEKLNRNNVRQASFNALPGGLYREVMDPLSRALDEAFQAYYEAKSALSLPAQGEE